MLLLSVLLPALSHAATLDHAYWAPDRGTPYKWFEGARDIQTYFEKDYRAAGYLYVYLRNDGPQPIEATGFALNGSPLADLRKQQEVVWWRLLPRKIPPSGVGEVMIRLRNALTAACDVSIALSDGSTVIAHITPEPNPIRIETVGFAPSRDRVFLVVEALDAAPHELSQVLLDGRDVTRDCRLLAPGFVQRVSPVSLRLGSPLSLDSYHVYTVRTTTGETASCCLHTTDGWVPLGSYGYVTLEEFARNGCNGHNNFGRATKGNLDSHAAFGMRQVTMLGGGQVNDYEVGHPGLFAYCLQDEPDCADYNVGELPHPQRIGQHAMEMEARAQHIRERNPTKPSLLTLDLTYKPANFYTYGPLADIANPDCYPLSIQTDATMVREVVETCRLGAGPRQMSFTFQGVLEGPRDPGKFDKLRFPRPAFPTEQRIMMLYAIGAGARGLFNYIHCTENSETRWSRGSGEFPEVWNEIGQVYRELDHVAPLLALAHPTKLATSDQPKLWLRTLLCGEDALLIVWVNDSYEQKRLSVPYTPLTDVVIRLPELPWLANRMAFAVSSEGFSPLTCDGERIRVPRMEVGGLILVTADPELPASLTARYEARTAHYARVLLDEWRDSLAASARRKTAFRLITGEFGEAVLDGTPVNAYGMAVSEYWNPRNAQHNVYEFGVNDRQESPRMGVEWTLTIPAERAGQPHILYALCGTWGEAGVLSVKSPGGETVAEQQVEGSFGAGELCKLHFTPEQAGEYRAAFLLPGRGPKGGRAANAAYLIPEAAAFDPVLR